MKEQNTGQGKKPLPISIAGVILGFICLIISVYINIFAATTYLGGGAGDVAIIFAIPVIIFYGIGIAINIISLVRARKTKKEQKTKNTMLIPIIGLILSLSCIIAIPLFAHNVEKKSEEEKRKAAEITQMQEAQEIAFQTEPTITEQLYSYTSCYSYKDNTEYRAARDAICSYLRYTYSHDWQEPETAGDLISAEYTPKYFYQISDMERDHHESISISRHPEEISRQFVQGLSMQSTYVITPHQSCLKEKNDSLISVWYLSNNIYNDEEQDFVCMYYDYHEDTRKAKLQAYEGFTLNIYSAEFKDFYETLLGYLYRRSYSNEEYDFIIPYSGEHGIFLYSNSEFLKTFFSAWPEGYFLN